MTKAVGWLAAMAAMAGAIGLAGSEQAFAVGPRTFFPPQGAMAPSPIPVTRGGHGHAGFVGGPQGMVRPSVPQMGSVAPQHRMAPTLAVPQAIQPARVQRPVVLPSYPQPVVPARPYSPVASVPVQSPVRQFLVSRAPYLPAGGMPAQGAVGMLADRLTSKIVNKTGSKVGVAVPQPYPAYPQSGYGQGGPMHPGYGQPGYGQVGYMRPGHSHSGFLQPGYPQPIPVTVNRPVFQRPALNVFGGITNVNTINNITNLNVTANISGGYRPWSGHFDHLHNNWCSGYWKLPIRPSIWIQGQQTGWASLGGTAWTYANPYYVRPPVVGVFDYTRPIISAAVNYAQYDQPQMTEGTVRLMTAARESFRRGEYADAQRLCEQAIALLPADRVLHEFRALVLFARADYREAAATIYAVLASGPGWDPDTLASIYPDGETYSTQVKSLGNFVRNNPQRADARFLFAYHLLTLGYGDAALEQLDIVRQLQPNDRVAYELAAAIRQPIAR